MRLQLRTSAGTDPAEVELAGIAFPQCTGDALRLVAQESRARGDRRLLVDLRQVVGGLADYEHRQLGEMAAQHFGHLQALACVLAPGQLTDAGARVAREGGANVQVFGCREDALAWLRDFPRRDDFECR